MQIVHVIHNLWFIDRQLQQLDQCESIDSLVAGTAKWVENMDAGWIEGSIRFGGYCVKYVIVLVWLELG